jgi:hypothetical protein
MRSQVLYIHLALCTALVLLTLVRRRGAEPTNGHTSS